MKTIQELVNTPLTILQPVGYRRHPDNQRLIDNLRSVFGSNFMLIDPVGISSISRARNLTASLAHTHVEKVGGMVLWLDADMTCDVMTVLMHMLVSEELDMPITGRCVIRNSPKTLASCYDENKSQIKWENQLSDGSRVISHEILCGLACLMMPAKEFLEVNLKSPKQIRLEGEPLGPEMMYLVCAETIVPDKKRGYRIISEDHHYINSLEEGAYLVDAEIKQFNYKGWFDYGHIVELAATPQSHHSA